MIEKQELIQISLLLPENYTSTRAKYVGKWTALNLIDTQSQESNSEPYNCKADVLPYDHRKKAVSYKSFSFPSRVFQFVWKE